jgi:hypothetical protein
MTAIKTKEQPNHSALKFLPTATSISSRRRHTYVGAAIAASDGDGNSWKQNAAHSQVNKILFLFFSYLNSILEKNS